MKPLGVSILAGAVALIGLGACQRRDDHALGSRLDRIDQRVAKIEQLLAHGGAAQPARPRERRPDPGAVYAAPIAGAPYEGVKNAKVTIVEAFDFA